MSEYYVKFFVEGKPIAQPRHRMAMSKKGKPHAYTPSGAIQAWKAAVMLAAKPHRPLKPLEGPVELGLRFYFARPQRLLKKTSPTGRIPHIIKPDRNNLVKAVEDALTEVGIWKDDCQIWNGIWMTSKEYVSLDPGAGSMNPGVLIVIKGDYDA